MKNSTHRTLRGPSAAVAVVLLILLVTACGPSAERSDAPQPLVVSIEPVDGWTRNFNPLSNTSDQLWPTLAGVYEPLMVFNTITGTHEPWLATEYAWDDTDRIVTFSLRPGVRWSDGEDFGADDVVFTFDLLRDHPELDQAGVWQFLSEVVADPGKRVRFVFQHTFVPGLELLARQPIVPEHIWKDVADPVSSPNENPVATGPFTEVRHFDETVYELGRNPHYWQAGKPAVEAVRLPAYRDNAAVQTALYSGEIDWSGNFVPDAEVNYVAHDPEHRVFWSPLTGGSVLLLANVTRSPFADVRVREALSMAIDRERLAAEAMNGATRPADATALDDAQQRYRDPEAVARGTWVHYAPEDAERLLDEAGFPRGEMGLRGPAGGQPWQFEILVPAGWSDWEAAVRIIVGNFLEVGVAATSHPLDFADWETRMSLGDFDLGLRSMSDDPTPYARYRSMMSASTVRPVGVPSTLNWHRFSDAQADALLNAFEMTSDAELQEELIRRLQLRFVEIVPAIPLFLAPSWGACNSTRYVGFPSADDPYTRLSPYAQPECLLVLTRLRPH